MKYGKKANLKTKTEISAKLNNPQALKASSSEGDSVAVVDRRDHGRSLDLQKDK